MYDFNAHSVYISRLFFIWCVSPVHRTTCTTCMAATDHILCKPMPSNENSRVRMIVVSKKALMKIIYSPYKIW